MKWRWLDLFTILWRPNKLKENLFLILRCWMRGLRVGRGGFQYLFQKKSQCLTSSALKRTTGSWEGVCIYVHFQTTGASDTAQGLSDLLSICLQYADVQDFDTRWDQILLGTIEMPRNRLQGFEQLQTVFAMYNQELSRDRVPPSCEKLRKMVRQHVDQTIRFKAQNERIEIGVLVKSQKGRNVSADRKVGECFQWKANGQCSRGESCSHSGQRAHNHPLLLQERRHRLTQENLATMATWEEKVFHNPSQPCKNFLRGTCMWFPAPFRVLESQAWIRKYGDECKFLHTEAGGQPSKKVKERWRKRIGGIIKRDYSISPSEMVDSAGKWKVGIESNSQVLKGRDATREHSEKKVHRRESFKSANLRSEIHGLPNSREERKTKP